MEIGTQMRIRWSVFPSFGWSLGRVEAEVAVEIEIAEGGHRSPLFCLIVLPPSWGPSRFSMDLPPLSASLPLSLQTVDLLSHTLKYSLLLHTFQILFFSPSVVPLVSHKSTIREVAAYTVHLLGNVGWAETNNTDDVWFPYTVVSRADKLLTPLSASWGVFHMSTFS